MAIHRQYIGHAIPLHTGHPTDGTLKPQPTLRYNYTEMPFSLKVLRGSEQLFAIEASRFIFKVTSLCRVQIAA
jgi:hypothetical protein